jgi:hypothetical protein
MVVGDWPEAGAGKAHEETRDRDMVLALGDFAVQNDKRNDFMYLGCAGTT